MLTDAQRDTLEAMAQTASPEQADAIRAALAENDRLLARVVVLEEAVAWARDHMDDGVTTHEEYLDRFVTAVGTGDE